MDYDSVSCSKTKRRIFIMDTSDLTLKYDREGDILYIQTCQPYPEQDSDELGDEVVARFNPKNGEIESLEILFFLRRFEGDFGKFKLPVSAHFCEIAMAGID